MSLPLRDRAGAEPRVTTLHALLEALAKRDASGEIVLKSDGTRAFHIVRKSSVDHKAAVAVWFVFRQARDGGFLAPLDEHGLRWVLSGVGRVALRRQRSHGEGSPIPATGTLILEPTHSARIDPAESPLSWLRRRKDKSGEPMITAVQFDAGERLRADFLFAEISPRVTVNWSANGGSPSRSGGGLGVDLRDSTVAAMQRVRRALAAVGALPAGLLIDVCGHLKGLEEIERARGWPPRSGKIALQMALSDLARHYGLPGADEGAERVAHRLRHWGTPGYRPAAGAQAD